MSSKNEEMINAAEFWDQENSELNHFEDEVRAAIYGRRHADFRIFLRRCYQAELREEQVIRILMQCWQFEQLKVQPSLLFYTNGAALRIQQKDDHLSLMTSRVAVLYAMVYSSGIGIPRNDSLAWRYAELAMEMKCREGYLLAGIMASKSNPVLAEKYFEEVKNINPILQSIVDKDRQEIQRQDEEEVSNKLNVVSIHAQTIFARKNHYLMCSFAKQLIGHIRYMQQRIDSESLETNANNTVAKIDLIDLVARLLTRSYLAHRQKGEQKNAEEADQALFDCYEFQKGIFERERKLDEQSATIQLQYYYGVIDPNLYIHLVDTCENKDVILWCILEDQVLSSRAKMRRVIELVGQKPPLLFQNHEDSVEKLGHLSYQAQLDCMALLSCVAPEYQKEIADELRQITQFVNHFQTQMKRDKVFAPVKERASKVFKEFLLKMEASKEAGFLMALRLLLGETPGSEKIVLSKEPNTALRLFTLLSRHDFNFIFEKNPEIRKKELLITIVQEVEVVDRDSDLMTILEHQKNARFDSVADNDLNRILLGQSKHSDEGILNQTADYDTQPDLKLKQDALDQLQNLADFYTVLPYAKTPELEADVIWDRKMQFEWFLNNRQFLDAVIKAVELFQSPEYQPSTLNVFSETFGKRSQYEAQLEAANTLVIDCKRFIFDRTALAKKIEQFLKDALPKPKPPCFALALMEVMGSEANRLIPKNCFDLEKSKISNYENPLQTFREFCSAFTGCYLYTDILSARITSGITSRLAF